METGIFVATTSLPRLCNLLNGLDRRLWTVLRGAFFSETSRKTRRDSTLAFASAATCAAASTVAPSTALSHWQHVFPDVPDKTAFTKVRLMYCGKRIHPHLDTNARTVCVMQIVQNVSSKVLRGQIAVLGVEVGVGQVCQAAEAFLDQVIKVLGVCTRMKSLEVATGALCYAAKYEHNCTWKGAAGQNGPRTY